MSPNFIYGILGSIVGTALTVAVYSIVNSGSDTEIPTEPTITNLLQSSIIHPTTNLGKQGLHNVWGWGLVSITVGFQSIEIK